MAARLLLSSCSSFSPLVVQTRRGGLLLARSATRGALAGSHPTASCGYSRWASREKESDALEDLANDRSQFTRFKKVIRNPAEDSPENASEARLKHTIYHQLCSIYETLEKAPPLTIERADLEGLKEELKKGIQALLEFQRQMKEKKWTDEELRVDKIPTRFMPDKKEIIQYEHEEDFEQNEENEDLDRKTIPQFIDLSMTDIEQHTATLKPYTTAWANPPPDHVLQFEYVDYYSAYEKKRHSAAKVVLQVKIDDLKLSADVKENVIGILGERYNEKTNTLRIVSRRYPTKNMNKVYLHNLLNVIIDEASNPKNFE